MFIIFENITHIEIFSTSENDKKVVNKLLSSDWTILAIVQNSEHNNFSYGQIILGATDEAFQMNNLAFMKQKKQQAIAEKKRIEKRESDARNKAFLAEVSNDNDLSFGDVELPTDGNDLPF